MFLLNGAGLTRQPQYAARLKPQFAVNLDFLVTPADQQINSRVTSRSRPPLRLATSNGWGAITRAAYTAHPTQEVAFAQFTVAGVSTVRNHSRFYSRYLWSHALSYLTIDGLSGAITAFVYDGANRSASGGTPVEGQSFNYVMVLDGVNMSFRTTLAAPAITATGGYTGGGGGSELGGIVGQSDSEDPDCKDIYTALLLRQYRPWSVAEQNEFLRNPWHIFQAPTRRIFLPSGAGGGTTYTIIPSGGVVFSGATALRRERRLAISGGFSLAGAVSLGRIRVQPTSGGVGFSGGTALGRVRVQGVSGGVVFAGTAPMTLTNGSNTFTITPSGGVIFAGSAMTARERQQAPAGGASFAGTAPFTRNRTLGISGGILFSGTVVLGKTRVVSPAGGIAFSGNAGLLYTPAGGIVGGNISRISLGLARGSRIS